jgi:hypothetical protein
MIRRSLAGPFLLLALNVASCGASTPPGARDVRFADHPGGQVVRQEELQQDLQRFSGDLMSRLADVMQPLAENPSVNLREEVMRQFVRDYAAALDVATGPTPELDLLDMVVFVRLTGAVFDRHWLGIYGEPGKDVAGVWKTADARLGMVTAKVLNDEQRGQLRSLADGWLRENPTAVRVEDVRFWQFAERESKISAQSASEAGGLFGAVKGATQLGNEAILLGERFRFIAMRAPLLIRLESRLGASEVTSDALKRVEELRVEQMPPGSEAKGLIQQVESLVTDSHKAERRAMAMVQALQPLTEYVGIPENLNRLVSHVEGLDNKTVALLGQAEDVLGRVQTFVPGDAKSMQATISGAEKRFDALARRLLLDVGVLGAALTVLFWAGYVLAKRATARSNSRTRGPLQGDDA